jgi:hypothetical protein
MDSYICYFDILGYKSILKHNSSRKILEKILHLINTAPLSAEIFSKAKIKSMEEPICEEFEQIISDRMNSFVYSDTILISCDLTDANELIKSICSCRMLYQASLIYTELLILGLPLRGCIHFGDFVAIKNSFAGIGFLEAHDYAEELYLSGIRVTDDFENSIINTLSRCVKLLRWSHDFSRLLMFNDDALMKVVNDRFLSHEKDITESVKIINNTVNYLIYLRDNQIAE